MANNRSAYSAVSVSIVIPAYNEEQHIAACLQSIAAQTVQPFEVIVVDNNSTDQTVAIARRFPFVKIVHEARQGVVFARDQGFNAARGSIIGRIDADSILTTHWVETVQTLFSNPSLDAASGIVHYRDVSWSAAFDAVDLLIRRYMATRMERSGEQFLYGVNMALRRSVWHTVRNDVCHERAFHEDQDLAIHLSERKKRIIFTQAMQTSISPRQAAAGPREFLQYVWSNSKVYDAHSQPSVRYINRVALAVSCLYVPIHIMYRGYNPKTGRFSFTQALGGDVSKRVSPLSETV
ncbi:MAG TPA: glycosyltransferase family 2 protein [Candidatus Saccharimonadales bacterium]|nr:glycosyltransferase family 2 protein [Candidatus Saccharimonadales bacterium]